ncbi:MAG: transglutaminase domain-containing protein [Candidatus Aenigmarchaeota archaeon]|nr:transglutaminase domain-containing protein [Candidatus Aenigmarchaeota archaeon]
MAHHVKGSLMFDDGIKAPTGMKYGSDFSLKLSYAPVSKEGTPVVYKGRFDVDCFDPTYSVKDMISSHNVPVITKGLVHEGGGEGEISEANTLVVTLRIKEDRLSRSPSQRQPMIGFAYVSTSETDEFLEELGNSFNAEYLGAALEKIRQNIKYGTQAENLLDDIVRNRAGICRDFACLLDYAVKKAGGISDMAKGRAMNLRVRGIPVFRTIDEGTYGFHGWNEIYHNGEWNLVDPTIYTNSPDEIKERAINEVRDIYFLEPPVPSIYLIDAPKVPVNKGMIILNEPLVTAKLVSCEIINS